MVTATIQSAPQAPPQVETRPPAGICGRCGARMLMGYDEPQCLLCGNTDYSNTREFSSNRQNLLSRATLHVVRYAGNSPTLTETSIHSEVVRRGNRARHDFPCPFCSQEMEEVSLSGKRPDAKEQRFKCGYDHRVSIRERNGMYVWD